MIEDMVMNKINKYMLNGVKFYNEKNIAGN